MNEDDDDNDKSKIAGVANKVLPKAITGHEEEPTGCCGGICQTFCCKCTLRICCVASCASMIGCLEYCTGGKLFGYCGMDCRSKKQIEEEERKKKKEEDD